MAALLPSLALLQAHDADALAALFAGVGCLGIAVIGLVCMLFPIFCFWRIFTKAGYNGAMALIWLVPFFGPLVVICILAFGNWPGNRGQ